MTKELIIKYILETPHNINPVILNQMLDEFNQTELVTSKEELVSALVKGGYVALSGDIELDKEIIITNNTKLDLNGQKIIAPESYTDWFLLKADGANLVISGKGLISAGNSEKAIPVTSANGGKVTILDGEFACRGQQQCVYSNGGTVDIYGGTYRVVDGDETKDLLNVQNTKNVTDIQVYGGTFIGRDPALGDDNLGGSFVAKGYRSVEIEKDVFKVMK